MTEVAVLVTNLREGFDTYDPTPIERPFDCLAKVTECTGVGSGGI